MKSPEEKARFAKLLQALLWVKKTTGRPSHEVVNAVLRNNSGSYSELISGKAGTA